MLQKNNEKGMTLTEVLMVTFLFSLFLIPFFSIVTWNINTSSDSLTMQSQKEDFRVLNLQLAEDLRDAATIDLDLSEDRKTLSYDVQRRGSFQRERTFHFEEAQLLREVSGEEQYLFAGSPLVIDGEEQSMVEWDGDAVKIYYDTPELSGAMVLRIYPRNAEVTVNE